MVLGEFWRPTQCLVANYPRPVSGLVHPSDWCGFTRSKNPIYNWGELTHLLSGMSHQVESMVLEPQIFQMVRGMVRGMLDCDHSQKISGSTTRTNPHPKRDFEHCSSDFFKHAWNGTKAQEAWTCFSPWVIFRVQQAEASLRFLSLKSDHEKSYTARRTSCKLQEVARRRLRCCKDWYVWETTPIDIGYMG